VKKFGGMDRANIFVTVSAGFESLSDWKPEIVAQPHTNHSFHHFHQKKKKKKKRKKRKENIITTGILEKNVK